MNERSGRDRRMRRNKKNMKFMVNSDNRQDPQKCSVASREEK